MRTVIIRDDDTNALTPVACLERLYRPFLARGLPVNLATIPEVRTDARTPDGRLEGFLQHDPARLGKPLVALAENPELNAYLRANSGYQVVQHGCHHDTFEFDRTDRLEVVRRLELGAQRLREAGFATPHAFVAPHDKISRVAYHELARRFRVVSTGWFEWRRIPAPWLPRYVAKKLLRRPHWRVGRTQLLSHPGCLLSYQRPYETMLASIQAAIARQPVTVLVTHWWEYFRDGRADERFIRVLHDTAAYLAAQPDIRVTTFEALASGVDGLAPGARRRAFGRRRRRRNANDVMSRDRRANPHGVERLLFDLVSRIPRSAEQSNPAPHDRAQAVGRFAALKAAGISGALALPAGPLGWTTILPDLLAIWRLQRAMVADIAAIYGQTAFLGRETMVYCLFKHGSAALVRDLIARAGERYLVRPAAIRAMQRILQKVGVRVSQRVLERSVARFIPLIGAVGVAAYAYRDTAQVAATAIELFSQDLELEAT